MLEDGYSSIFPIHSAPALNDIIRNSINHFFGGSISCSDRLLETFKYRTKEMMGIPPYGLWVAAIKQYPQLTDFLISNGFEFDKIKWTEWPKVEKSNIQQNWFLSLNKFFQFDLDGDYSNIIPYSEQGLDLYNKVKERGSLSIYDCLIGTLRDQKGDWVNSAIEFLYQGTHNGQDIPFSPGPLGSRKMANCQIWSNDISINLEKWNKQNELKEESSFILYHEGNKIRLRPFTQFNINLIENPYSSDKSQWQARSNVFEKYDLLLENALSLLEDLINSSAKEIEFQRFFETHPQFLLLLGNYKKLHSQLILKRDDGSKLIPDFFLEKIDSDFCDILDLKRPTVELVRLQKNRTRFRECVMESVAQLEHYRNWFEDKKNRDRFRESYGLNSLRPQVVVVIGRKKNYYDEITRIKLESSLPKWVNLTTYDDIIEKVRQWRNFTTMY